MGKIKEQRLDIQQLTDQIKGLEEANAIKNEYIVKLERQVELYKNPEADRKEREDEADLWKRLAVAQLAGNQRWRTTDEVVLICNAVIKAYKNRTY